jgi:gliding motility associated protien GldN
MVTLLLCWNNKLVIMKKTVFVLMLVGLVSLQANSQFSKLKKPATTGDKTGAPAKKDTTGKGGTTPPGGTTTKPTTTLIKPSKRFDTTRESGSREYGSKVPQSGKNNYIYKRDGVNDRNPLSYDYIREDDATYSQFVWREIDAREKMNAPFIYSAKDETGDQRFFSIILEAIKNSDSAIAFDATDDRFTTPLSYADVMSLSTNKSSKLDTTYSQNPDNEDIMDTVIIWKENIKAPKPDSIYKFRIKEQWFFDKESSRMFVRIIGIAPMAPAPLPPGMKKAVGPPTYYPLFWVYYPDLRPTLSKSFAYNPKNAGGRMTWEEIFEGRFFSSYITKSTLDNPYDKTLTQLIKDPLFRLLEGENIKEKIFNYEQDLWSY